MTRERLRDCVLAVGAGAAMALALPGPGLVPLVLAVPGLLRRSLEGVRGWRAFRVGWVAGFVQWLIAVAWVVIVLHRYGHVPLLLSLLGLVLMAVIMGLGWALVGWATSLVPPGWRVWLLPLGLVAFEQIQHLPPWIFPWNPAAAVVTSVPALMRPAPVLGAAGLSLLLYLTGSALDAVVDRHHRSAGLAWLLVSVAAFVAASLLAPPFRPVGPPVMTAAVQPDVPLEMRWDRDNLGAIEARVWRLSAAAAKQGARLVVWPESAVPRIVESDGAYRVEIERFTREYGVWLLLGSIGIGPGEGEYANSVFVASPGGLLPWRYDKIHLVPFGEYLPGPVRWLLPHALVREVGSFTPGHNRSPLPSPAGPVGVAVCYEVAFPSLYAAEVRRGAEILATITNDGWYGDSAAPRQHLALAILRAVENRRWLVRAANTGISAIIDPNGRVVSRLGVGERGVIAAAVEPGSGVTPAAAWGGAVRASIVVFAVGAILLAVWRRSARESTSGDVAASHRGKNA
ncbi:MAG: apolipoprotein N-acyltransferase [Acidobacteriota bacterium]